MCISDIAHYTKSNNLDVITGISPQGRSISYNIRQEDELQHHQTRHVWFPTAKVDKSIQI